MSFWNKLQGTGAAVKNPRYAGHTKRRVQSSADEEF